MDVPLSALPLSAHNSSNIATNSSNIDVLQKHTRGFSWTASSGASASGTGSTALGDGAAAKTNDTAIGSNARVNMDGSTAVGANTTIDAPNSVAIGADSRVVHGAAGSVALGQGSVASEPNTVSVGSGGHERRITNVSEGIEPNDAATVRQVNRSTALASAMSSLVPNGRVNGNLQAAIGIGHAGHQIALAGGMFYYVKKNIMVNAGISTTFDKTTERAGVTFSF